MAEKATYTHGHHSSVVNSHARRTAQNSAAFLLPHIKPTDRILDLGCGPGSITVGLAKLVPNGAVIGGDSVEDILHKARDLASQEFLTNLTFQQVDGNALPFPDAAFDITFCHQVLQHVGDPVGVLREMRRVTKSGGIVAARDADYKSFAWYPELPDLDLWGAVYQAVAKANGAEPNAGRYLPSWARSAGLSDVVFSWSTWHYRDADAEFWGDTWAKRSLQSDFAVSVVKHAVASRDDLQKISSAWLEWARLDHRFIVIPNGEILCRVP